MGQPCTAPATTNGRNTSSRSKKEVATVSKEAYDNCPSYRYTPQTDSTPSSPGPRREVTLEVQRNDIWTGETRKKFGCKTPRGQKVKELGEKIFNADKTDGVVEIVTRKKGDRILESCQRVDDQIPFAIDESPSTDSSLIGDSSPPPKAASERPLAEDDSVFTEAKSTRTEALFKEGLAFKMVEDHGRGQEQWLMRNETTDTNLRVEYAFGPESKIKSVGAGSVPRAGADGWQKIVGVIPPGQTLPFIRGSVNGFRGDAFLESPNA